MDPIPNLMGAARAGNINGLYEVIKKKPTLLKEIDEIPFVNTPLHEAASAGQTHFATVMIDLAPSFVRKLNPDCLSPLDLAVINNHYDTVKMLVSFDGELVRVKGKDRLTPLHRAAESDDNIRCLLELLLACPASIEDLTIRDETALDIARNSSSGAEAFKILYEWVSRAGDHKRLLQKKDAQGNSAEAYHKKQQPKVVSKSLEGVQVKKPSSHAETDDDTQNLYNYLRTPERFYERQLRKVLVWTLWSQRDLTMEMKNVVLVVAVLIATASFQTVLSPPGGEGGGLASHSNSSSSQHNDNGFVFTVFNETTYNLKQLAGGEDFFSRWFFFLNTIAFTASVGVIVIVLELRAYTSILHLSLIFMLACYWSSLRRVILSPLVAFIYYIGSSFYVFWVYYFKILFWTIESRKPEWVAILLLSPCLKQNFRCLHQMGALTLK